MNWYSVFYWLTVANNVSVFLGWMAGIMTAATIIMTVVQVVVATNEETLGKRFYKWWWTFIVCSLIGWAGFVLVPDRESCLLIIAGGSVGNFITSDSSSRQIPAEVTLLLRDKLRQEVKEIHILPTTDTLKDKTREQLIELIKK